MAVTKPASFADWVPSGDPTLIQDPPGGQHATGWTEGQPIPFEYLNWLFYILDQWTQYLDQNSEPSNLIVAETATFTAAYPASIYICTPILANMNANLPPATSPMEFTFKNAAYGGSNTVTVVPNGSNKIENAAAATSLNPGDDIKLATVGDGNWWQL